jgi:flagellar protein FliT
VSHERILIIYESALEVTERMFTAARAGDWDALVALERERDRHVEEARSLEDGQAGPAALRARKRELLQKILAREEEIRILTQDWMHELREILDSASNSQRLNRAYSQS